MEATLGIVLAIIFVGAVIESALFPLPLTLLMAPAVYEFTEAAPAIVVVATMGSALGSVGGNRLGRWRGEAVLRRAVSAETFAWTERAYRRHGTFGLLVAAVSPLPYIPFTVASGIYGTRLRSVFLVAVSGRGIKYGMEVLALVWLTSLELTSAFLAIGVGLTVAYLAWNYALKAPIYGLLRVDPAG